MRCDLRPTDLKDPKSAISGATPVLKDSQHFFFKLPDFQQMLQTWTRSGTLQDAVANKIAEWLDAGLQQWDISRDAPYFGFEIPDEPGKYFYVWLDAPIGYMASFKNLCNRTPELDFDAFWARTRPPSCTTSSARTSSTSTPCSGLPCSKAPVSANRPGSTCTAT